MNFSFAVLSLGNIGKYCIEALEVMPDCSCLGIIRRKASLGTNQADLRGLPEFTSLEELIKAKGKPDVVLIASPSRNVPEDAKTILQHGLCTVDSFDIHEQISPLIINLDTVAKANKTVSVSAAGWDPGSDSVLRALFEAMVPVGTSFTNFGRGRSMGHSVAVRNMSGVVDATSITIPMGGGRHSRLVYVVLQDGANFEEVKATIKADPYFSHDPLEVRQVSQAELPFVADASHGVNMERIGASGFANNQRLSFDMHINNPALTAQIMVSCGRAAARLKNQGQFGAYTMIDLAPVQLLPGTRMDNIGRLV